METRELGETGLQVSVLGFGGATLGNEYGDVRDQDATEAVHYAIDQGITFVDVAPYYGRTLAEERLGRALEGRRDKVVLATKCCRYDRRGFDFSAKRVMEDIDSSLKRLRTDRIDLFQIHDVEFGDTQQILQETLPAMREVQASGKARFIGITGLPVHLLAQIAQEFPVDTVLSYCHYNLLVDDLSTVLSPLARTSGFGLINASPLHMGILSPGGERSWHPADDEVKTAGRAMAAACKARGKNIAEVALQYAMHGPEIASTLCGMRTPAEVTSNLAAYRSTPDDELMAELHAIAAPVKNRTWHEGLPENAPS